MPPSNQPYVLEVKLNMLSSELCMTCCSTIASGSSQHEVKPKAMPFVHGCCRRFICSTCIANNARLATFCPFCEDPQTAFRKGRRHDVTRAGDTLFDFDKALSGSGQAVQNGSAEESLERDVPPAYEAGPDFVLAYDDSTKEDAVVATATASIQKISKIQLSEPGTFKPIADHTHAAGLAEVLPEKIKVPPDSGKEQTQRGTGESAPTDGETRQYWLRPEDTLSGLALRFRVPDVTLCTLNQLPRSALATTPHILHTRHWILLPANCISVADAAEDSKLQEALTGPLKLSAASKRIAARRGAELRFQATIMRTGGGAMGQSGETPPDERAASAYIALAEQELAWVDFDEQDMKQHSTQPLRPEDDESDEQLRDSSCAARYDAILSQAVAKWMMDSNWERAQRAAGLDPSKIPRGRKFTDSRGGHAREHSGFRDAMSQFFGSMTSQYNTLMRPTNPLMKK